MKLISSNQIFVPFTPFTQSHTFQEFCEKYARVNIEERNKESSYYFYTQKNDGFYFTRGLLEELKKLFEEHTIPYEVEYDYNKLEPIEIENKIESLRTYQIPLDKVLSEEDNGFVVVPTGWWKTVVIINDIAKRKEKSLILVHTKLLAEQFIERTLSFTNLKKEDIGLYGSWKKEIKKVTVALMQSFWKLKASEIQEVTKDIGSFFIDESHHLKASTFLHIAKNVRSKRIYWLTATPDKADGIANIFLQKVLGPLLYRVSEFDLEKEGIIIKPHLEVVVNDQSHIVDIYRDFYKSSDWSTIKKYYWEQFLNSGTPFIESYIKEDWCTIVEFSNMKELNNLLKNTPPSLKDRIKVFPTPLFKNHESCIYKGQILFSLKNTKSFKQIDPHKIKRELYNNIHRARLVGNIIYHEFKNNRNKDPYILVLSDTVEHLDFMYSQLPDKLKDYAIVFCGAQKKKEKEAIDKEIDERKYRIIFSTDKFVGEGWDKSFLDTLIVTHLLKDHEWLKQLVGRVIRKSEGKKYATIYDIVDQYCWVTLNQFKKRYKNYYSKRAYIPEGIDLIINHRN